MAKFEVVSKQTLADSIFEQLHDAIVHGDLSDGEELNQVALAEQFSVSRVPVREALWRLEAENLVVATPQQRFRVVQMKPDSILELAEIRELLEVYALRRRMASLSDADVAELQAAADAVRSADDKEAWLTADRNFHRVLNGTDSPVASLIESVRSQIHRYLKVVVSSGERQRQAEQEHAALLERMIERDTNGAEKALREHIRATREVLAQHL